MKKCCRNCHWFDNNHCLHNKTFVSDKYDGYKVGSISEEGIIADAINEALDFESVDFSSLQEKLKELVTSAKKNKNYLSNLSRSTGNTQARLNN